MKAQKGRRGTVLPILNTGARWGEGQSIPHPGHFTPRQEPWRPFYRVLGTVKIMPIKHCSMKAKEE
jgi:hypothetical protein